MTDRSTRKRGLRVPSLIVVALIATAFVFFADSREASGYRLIDILSTAKSAVDANEARKGITKVHGKLLDRLGEYFDLIENDGTEQQAEAVWQRTRRNLAGIPLAADPTYGGAEFLLNKAKSAARKIESFLGGARQAVSGASAKAKVDLRAALAVGDKDRKIYESQSGILGGTPLPTPASAKASPAGSASKPWFKGWVLKQQENYPQCWGIVGADSDPNDCMAKADANREAAARASQKAEPEQPGNDKVGWASGDWTAEGTGWSGWDRSDSRYDEADRESARVGIYALECWGVSGVTSEAGLYDLMKGRMARNECPEEDRSQHNSNQGRSGYEAALAGALGEEIAVSAVEGYRGALNALEARETEQRRLAEEEQQRLAEEERARQARLAEQRRLEAEMRSQEERIRRAEQAAQDAKRAQQQAKYREDMRRYMQIIEQNNRLLGEQLSNFGRSSGSSGGDNKSSRRSHSGGSERTKGRGYRCPDGNIVDLVTTFCTGNR